MSPIFDSPEFNSGIFLPRRSDLPPPPLARDTKVPVGDGVELHLRLHDRPNAQTTLLLFHGNGEYVHSYDAYAGHFAAAGARLAVVDFRGYGRSTGVPTLRNCITDAPRVLDAVLDMKLDGPLVVMGRSLGSVCAAEICRVAPDRVQGHVFESAPADLHAALRRRGLPSGDKLSAEDLATFDSLPKLALARAPALVLHGENDGLVPISEARLTLAALGSADKELFVVRGAGHNTIMDYPAYWESIGRLVSRLSG